ncbi:bcl-2-related ovarian killer protein homolog A-like [Pomacea canaliculata]|uniref:bcl-2-related ovarian killer protein homolog A-like n=1 Tax=Pomacea canaliculata TaxID=400727 RepID=UPI000D735512|nr:bcl-2-related ovarian killer protein homolog A-like [Pomacea canaliculata]
MSKRVKATPYQCPVADDLFAAGQELERLYPRIYCDVSRRISMTMTSPQLVRRALTTVLEATFRTGVTWAKVVSMVAIAAAFAEECVVQGHPNFVEDIVMCVGHFVAMNLTDWLAAQGGWDAFPTAKEPDIVKIPDGSLMLFTVVMVITGSLVVLLGLRVLSDTST